MKNLLNKVTLEWLKAAGIRALRTMAQTALGMLTIGAAINEINWVSLASVAFVAGVYSILTSLATSLPEVAQPVGSSLANYAPEFTTDGVLMIDTTGEKDIYRLNLNDELSTLSTKKQVVLTVDPQAKLSQE